MALAIDTTQNCILLAPQFRQDGYIAILRYYSRNSWKRLTPKEAQAISNAGMMIGVVYQDRQDRNEDFNFYKGSSAGRSALDYAGQVIFQPEGSAIYFSVDYDPTSDDVTKLIIPFFQGINKEFSAANNPYKVGVYGSGLTCQMLTDAELVAYTWLSQSTSYKNYTNYRDGKRWALAQNAPKAILGIELDTNDIADQSNFGGFSLKDNHFGPAAQPETAEHGCYKVIAATGLWVRTGPGIEYEKVQALPEGKLVTILKRDGAWAQISFDNSAAARGYVFAAYLTPNTQNNTEPVA